MIISVAGNISSGKTTLAKKISELYDFLYIPSKHNQISFLDSFFADIPKRFFATQTSFLVNKISEIYEKQAKNIVIDRSLYEDIHIFAQFWMDNYSIDDKEKALYKDLSDYMISTIPKSEIIIYCNCDKETQLERFRNRDRRSFENMYPSDYIQRLRNKYESIAFPSDSFVIEIDTKNIDVRDNSTVIGIMTFIHSQINSQRIEQISLFDFDNDKAINIVNDPNIKILQHPNNILISNDSIRIKKKRIYLAAPFTEFAIVEPVQTNSNQIAFDSGNNRDYNILPSSYQRMLARFKKQLSDNGQYEVILPHKDENNWGKTYISNNQIVESMINNMRISDLIVAIVSNSIGVHMELAMMSVQNKPMVLIIIDNLTSGFYADGFKYLENVLVMHVPSIDEVSMLLNGKIINNFIRRYLGNEKMDI